MPYLGNELAAQFQAFETQTITGDGSTGYTLDRAVANGKELLVYINNVKQEEGSGKSYTASGTTITFSEAVASGDSCYLVYMGLAMGTLTAPDGSIVSAQLANANLEMPNTLDMNGKELILDADGDTSIEASTDDTIVIDTGGSERARIDGSGNFFVSATATSGFQSSSSESGTIIYGAGGIASNSLTDDVAAVFNRLGTDGNILTCKKDGTSVFKIGFGGGAGFIDGASGDVGLKFEGLHIRPRDNGADVDNTVDLGNASFRFNDARITNGVTTGSDQNEKQNIESLTAKELKVANKLSALFKTYKWKDAVAEKGDKARTHTGIIAQDIQSAFSAEGLDASNYGMFMSDTWTNDDGKEQTRLGVRYPELFSFIFSSIEARLTALESK